MDRSNYFYNNFLIYSTCHVLFFSFKSYESFTIGFGSINRTKPLVTMRVDPIYRTIHPQYNSVNFVNDLALLRLPLNVTNTVAGIKPIRIPSRSQSTQTFVNAIAQVSGFGRLADQSPISDLLRYARTRVIAQNICVQYFGNAVVSANTICTLGQDFNAQGACANDNGGPLVLSETTGPTLIGIVSFISNSGCNAGHPIGYVRVSSYLAWLSQVAGIPLRN